MKHQKGFSGITVMVAVAILILVGMGIYFMVVKQQSVVQETSDVAKDLSQENPQAQQAVATKTSNTTSGSASSNSANTVYSDSTFGISFEYPKQMTIDKRDALWTSKAAYTAWMNDPNNAGGIGVNNLAFFQGANVAMILSVAPLGHYNAYDTMFYPETDQSFVINGIKVYRTTLGNASYVYWQNSHKPNLENLWNSVEISSSSAAEAKVVADIVASTLRLD